MTTATPEVRLERLLNALSEEVVDASDLELIEAAEDLRMNLTLRGTAAFLGVKGLYFPYRPEKFWGSDLRDQNEREPRRPEKS